MQLKKVDLTENIIRVHGFLPICMLVSIVSIVTKPWLWFGKGSYNSKARYASVSKLSESYNDLHYITLAWLTCLPTCLHDCMVTLFIAYYYMITFGCLRGKQMICKQLGRDGTRNTIFPFFCGGQQYSFSLNLVKETVRMNLDPPPSATAS